MGALSAASGGGQGCREQGPAGGSAALCCCRRRPQQPLSPLLLQCQVARLSGSAAVLPLLILFPSCSRCRSLPLVLLAGTRHTVKPLSPTTSSASLKNGLKASAATRPVCPAVSCTVLCAHSTLPCSNWQAGGAPQAGDCNKAHSAVVSGVARPMSGMAPSLQVPTNPSTISQPSNPPCALGYMKLHPLPPAPPLMSPTGTCCLLSHCRRCCHQRCHQRGCPGRSGWRAGAAWRRWRRPGRAQASTLKARHLQEHDIQPQTADQGF